MASWRKNKVAETFGLNDDPKVQELSANALDLTEVDKDIYHDLVDDYDAMENNLESGLKEYAPFNHLSEDMFNSLYKYNANLLDSEDVKSFSRFNHSIMEELMESEDFQKLRKSTKFDLMGSAMGTEALQSKAMERITYYKEQYKRQQKTGQPQPGADVGELIEQMNQMKDKQDKIDDLMNGSSDGAGGGLSQKDASKLAQHQKDLANMEKQLDPNAQEKMKNDMKDALEEESKKAKSDIDDVRDIVNSWGLEAGQSNRRISLDNRKKAIERIRRSPKLHELTDMIGRMRRMALDKKKQKVPDGHSIKSVEIGNKLESITPSEMMKLASPSTKKDFMRRYHQKQLMQYKKEDIQNTGRGPIIVCHDKSGSMNNSKDKWSTALALATLEIAQKENRNYAYIPYTTVVDSRHVKDIPAGGLDPEDVLDIAELPATGGTSFEAPLRKAIEFLQKSNYKKGDIMFITDGDCGVTDKFLDEFNKLKEEKKFFVNTVLINTDGGAGLGTVKRFSDHITTISNIADLNDVNAKDIFRITEDDQKFNQAPPDPNAKP